MLNGFERFFIHLVYLLSFAMKRFFTDIAKLQEAIKNRKLVVFAGAGISVDAGVPLWGDLISQLREEIEVPNREEDYLRIAQMYYNERQSKEYVEKIREILKYRQLRYNQIHEAILKLRPEHILTTNYDDLLDQAIQVGAYPFSVVSRDSQFPYSKNGSLLVKIHGDLDDNDFVLKEDDYLEYASRHPLIEAFIKSIFTSKVVLFVGYSFSDPNLKMILETVRDILGKHYQNAYLLSTDKALHPAQREYLKHKGVLAINFSDADSDGNSFVTAYLKGKNVRQKNYRIEGGNLSPHGQKLLDLLTFISAYDPFVEVLSKKDIVQQQYLSLKRFEELPVLPADFIANIYPFNASYERVFNKEHHALESNNTRLTDFYFENAKKQKDSENNTTLYQPKADSNTFEEETHVAKELRSAQIFYLKRGSDYVYIDSGKDLQDCECFRCLFYNLRWNDLIERVDDYEITDTSVLRDDMLAAYANYKLSNFKKSLKQYRKVALKAWQTDRTITYYTATRNIKSLRNLVKFYASSGSGKNKLVDELDELDIEEVFYQLHELDEDQRKLLRNLKDHDMVRNAELAINEQFDKTTEIYEIYQQGGMLMGPQYHKTVQWELTKMFTFYSGNCLVYDEYSEFKRVCEKGIKALLVNHAIPDSYPDRMDKFDNVFFTIFLFYGNTDKLKKIIRRYKISKLPAEPKDVKALVEKINNLLSSGKATESFFSEAQTKNALKVQFAKSYRFKRSYKDILSNSFLLLSLIRVEKECAQNIIDNLINFLESEEILGSGSISPICAFIRNQSEFISYENCVKLLQIGIEKPKLSNNSSELIGVIHHVIYDHFLGRTIENELSSCLISLFERNLALKSNFENIVYLWVISSSENRERIKSIVEQHLDKDFSIDFFRLALFLGITDEDRFIVKSMEVFNQHTNNNYRDNKGEFFHENERSTLTEFAYVLYLKSIHLGENLLEKIQDSPNCIKFFLFPERFDYTHFDPLWLLFCNPANHKYTVIYERLGSINAVKEVSKKSLKSNYNKGLAEVYTKYFL